MPGHRRFSAIVTATLVAMGPVRAQAEPIISVNSADYIPAPPPYSASTVFVVPVEITEALALTSWQFSLVFDPTDVQINTSCDSSGIDPYCDPLSGPVTEGPFFASVASFPPFFDPGFIFNAQGLLDGVAGAWQDPPPGPSGSGILAYVEFITAAGGSGVSPITVISGSTNSSPAPEPATVALVLGGLVVLGGRRLRDGPEFKKRVA